MHSVLKVKKCQSVFAVIETQSQSLSTSYRKANIGDNVTLRCSCQDEKLTLFTWYQQRLGGTPELISHAEISPKISHRSKSRRTPNNLLTITGLQATDSATYFCGVQVFGPVQFGDGIFVRVRASASVVQAEASAELGRGEPLELSCAVEAEACSGEKSVSWLKHGVSQVIVHPGEDCEKSARNCTVRLGIQSVEPTDAGVYYCVLSSCGEILFGNGTEVQITAGPNVLVYWLSTSLGLFIVATVALMIVVYNLKRKLTTNGQGKTFFSQLKSIIVVPNSFLK
uniref:Ig-like domain-containing protein n=1 Tax=Neogobius melanostomus TaxID=47308 RepID=A0A8C6WPV3_9GOBI